MFGIFEELFWTYEWNTETHKYDREKNELYRFNRIMSILYVVNMLLYFCMLITFLHNALFNQIWWLRLLAAVDFFLYLFIYGIVSKMMIDLYNDVLMDGLLIKIGRQRLEKKK